MNLKRQINFDLLRIFSIFCVIVLHVSASAFINTPNDFTWNVANIYDSIVRFCVPAFVMLSGVFFLNPERDYSIKKLFSKNILRIVIALIFWTLFYSLFYSIYLGGSLTFNFKDITKYALFHHVHLWFLYMLIGLYIIVPFLRKITENKRLTEYFLILSFIVAILLPFVKLLVGTKISNNISTITNDFNFHFVLGYPFYFVLGFYLSKYPLKKPIKICINVLALISIAFTIFMARDYYLTTGRQAELYYAYLLPTTMFVAIAVFNFFAYNLKNINPSEKAENFITILSRCTFGIYLMHELIRVLLLHFGFTPFIINPILSIPLISLTVFIISFIFTFIASKIPIVNKYLI